MSAPRRRLVVEADGGSRGNPGPAGYGALVRDADGRVLAERAGYLGVASNNVAEYSGLIAGLRVAAQIDPRAQVEVRMDSRLVVEQMSGRWQIKHEDMRRLAREAREAFPPTQVTYTWVERARNAAADALANEAMDARVDVVRDYPAGAPGDGADVSTAGAADAVPAPFPTAGPGDEAEQGVFPLGDGGGVTTAPDAPSSVRAARPSGAAVRFDDAEPVTVVLVRHGETPMTVSRQYSGSSVPGPGLTAAGRTQAARAADLVHRLGRRMWPDLPTVQRLLTSPMVRTQQTAAALGRRLGLTPEQHDAFAEADFGEWEGLTTPEITDRWPGQLQQWHTGAVRAPGGESLEDVAARVRPALATLVAAEAGRTVAVVSHAVTIRAVIGLTMRVPTDAWSGIRIPAASVSIVRWWPDGGTELVVAGCPTGP